MSQSYENNMYQQRTKNIWRTWFIITGFLLFVTAVGYGFAVYYNNIAILLMAAVGALASNVSSYFFSDKIALSVNNAKPARRSVPKELRLIRSVENMAITAGMPAPRVYVIQDNAPNAFATGRNEKKAAVAFTTGILNILNKTELEGVVAHELSHIKNNDILVGTIVVIMVGFVAILADLFTRFSFTSRRESNDGRAMIVIFVIGLVLAILAPIAARLIQFAVSRKREYLADASGALLTRYPEGLASALVKISSNAKPLVKTSSATAHLFIASPFGQKGQIRSFVAKLFSTHPPMENRVEALLGKRGLDEMNSKKEKQEKRKSF